MLFSALKRQNIKSLPCTPKNLEDWLPETDAIVFPHHMETRTWNKLKVFLENVNPTIPVILLGNIHKQIFNKPDFKKYLSRCIFIDDSLKLDQIVTLIKQSIDLKLKNNAGNFLKLGTLLLDKRSRTLSCKNFKVLLNRKEFYLMELLMLNVGQITTREAIIEYVWDRRSYVSQNTIDVYVSRLRKKIDSESKNMVISTIPCLGYQFSKKETLQKSRM
jgi:DNA-binding winged helix-turn-helix (wHTH) protein